MIDKLTLKNEQRPKDNFWASDFNKLSLDIYFAMTGEPVTNPPQWYETLKWGAGKGVEDAMLKILKDSDIVHPDYHQEEHGRVEHTLQSGVKITGKMDAVVVDSDEPIEVKSINNKNQMDISAYTLGKTRENYVGQLAIYQYIQDSDVGHLFVSSIDGLKYFWFRSRRIGNGIYQCGETIINLNREFERWSMILDCVKKRQLPHIYESQYKYPLEEIDWDTISQAKIAKARSNKAVIGDWQVKYSPWKDKILELQGVEPGYSEKELEYIKSKTKGYTSKKKK